MGSAFVHIYSQLARFCLQTHRHTFICVTGDCTAGNVQAKHHSTQRNYSRVMDTTREQSGKCSSKKPPKQWHQPILVNSLLIILGPANVASQEVADEKALTTVS